MENLYRERLTPLDEIDRRAANIWVQDHLEELSYLQTSTAPESLSHSDESSQTVALNRMNEGKKRCTRKKRRLQTVEGQMLFYILV